MLAGVRVEVVRQATSDFALVHLVGMLDGAFSSNFENARDVVLNLEGLRLAPGGLRAWESAIKRLRRCYFVQCHPQVVGLFNRVEGFAGGGYMVSLLAPYTCEAPHAEAFLRLVDVKGAAEAARTQRAPAARCPACGSAGELDEDPRAFFSYAALQPRRLVPSEVEAIALRLAPRPSWPSPTVSHVEQLRDARRHVAEAQERLARIIGKGRPK